MLAEIPHFGTLPRREFEEVPIPLIPIQEQGAIVEALNDIRSLEMFAEQLRDQLTTARRSLTDAAAGGYLRVKYPS